MHFFSFRFNFLFDIHKITAHKLDLLNVIGIRLELTLIQTDLKEVLVHDQMK